MDETCRLRQMREHAETGKIERFWTPRRESRITDGVETDAFPGHNSPQCGLYQGVAQALRLAPV